MRSVIITGDGTYPFTLAEGRWRLDLRGTRGGSLSVTLKSGPSGDGSDHVDVLDDDGSAVSWSGSSDSLSPLVEGAGPASLVVTGYAGSSNLAMLFRQF